MAYFISSAVPAQHRAQFKKLRSKRIEHRGFADSFIITVPLSVDGKVDDTAMAIGGIFTALFGVAGISLVALSHGIPLRAGLDIGLGLTNMFPNELYGPAMVKAYTLESKVARYPRAVLGSTLLDYLSVVEHLAPTDPVSKYAVLQAQDSRKLVCTDPDDGQSMLHVLSPLLFELMPDYKKYRGPAEAWVNEQALLFRKQKNDELAVRYSRLARYFGRYPSA